MNSSTRDGLAAWTVPVPLATGRLLNRAGERFAALLPTCAEVLSGLAVTYTAPRRSSFAEQALAAVPGLAEVALVLGDDRATWGGERSAGAAGPTVDEGLGCYLGGRQPTVLLKADAIEAAARRLGCGLAELAALVLRHECGHHFAPLAEREAPGYPSEPAVLARAEAAAQLFAWMTGSASQQSLAERLCLDQPAAYRCHQPLLAFARVRGTLAAWELCRREDGVALEGAAGWAGEEFEQLARRLDQVLEGAAWPSLRDLPQCVGPPAPGSDGIFRAPLEEALLWQADLLEQGLVADYRRGGGPVYGAFAAVAVDKAGRSGLVFQRLRTSDDARILSGTLRAFMPED